MVFFTVVGTLIIIYYCVYLVTLCFVDCDVGLFIAEKLGKTLGSLDGKVIWITGASSGIGEAIACEAAKQNVKLVLSARRENELERVKGKCLEMNKNLSNKDILILPLDITKTDLHKSCFEMVIEQFGTLDILINNAGRSQRAIWENVDIEVDRQMFDLNVFGVVALSRLAVQFFNKKGKGQIAVTSSLAGIIGAPFSCSYTGSKHAIHGYFESLRNEKMGTKLQITLLCPGPVFSNFLQESFTENVGEKFGESVDKNDKRMSADRCAKLALVAIVNKLDEAWIARFPLIPLTYALIYFPNISRKISKIIGPRRFQRLRDTKMTIKADWCACLTISCLSPTIRWFPVRTHNAVPFSLSAEDCGWTRSRYTKISLQLVNECLGKLLMCINTNAHYLFVLRCTERSGIRSYAASYGSNVNKYLVLESACAHMRIPYFVGLFGFIDVP